MKILSLAPPIRGCQESENFLDTPYSVLNCHRFMGFRFLLHFWIVQIETDPEISVLYAKNFLPDNLGTPPIDENPEFGTPPIDENSEFGTPPIDEVVGGANARCFGAFA